MVWFQVDDTAAFHHKTVAAGNAAMGLWVRAGAWSSGHLTDGYVPDAVAATIGSAAQRKRLVAVGLWEEVPGGYQFHEWAGDARSGSRRQRTAAEVQRDRARDRKRKARGRETQQWRREPLPEPPDDGYGAEPEAEPAAEQKNNLASTTSKSYARTVDAAVSPPDDLFSGEPQVSGGCPPGSPPEAERSPDGIQWSHTHTHIPTSGDARSSGAGYIRARPKNAAERIAELNSLSTGTAAYRLVSAWSKSCTRMPPTQLRTDLGRRVQVLLDEGYTPEEMERVITAWGAKGLTPSCLASVAHEVLNGVDRRARPGGNAARPNSDERVAAVLRLREELIGNAPDGGPNAIEGGA